MVTAAPVEFDRREYARRYHSLTPDEQRAFVAALTPEQRLSHLNMWEVRARPKQLAPIGDWRFWLILAGRGWGKSLAITQWAQSQATARPGSIGAMVASTAADVRDVLVGGPSGILVQVPEAERPHYSPTYRRLDWPNGSSALLFSADEPERFRGPQYHWAICDEYCFVAGTKIRSEKGEVAIESLRVGDKVWTRSGLKRIIRAGITQKKAQVYRVKLDNGIELTGTVGHPLWIIGRGWVRIGDIRIGESVLLWNTRLLSGVVKGGGSGQITTRTGKANSFTSPFTNRFMALFLKGMKSITETRTKLTTTSVISNFLRFLIIAGIIISKTGRGLCRGQLRSAARIVWTLGNALSPSCLFATSAEKSSKAQGCAPVSVPSPVSRITTERTRNSKTSVATTAEKNLSVARGATVPTSAVPSQGALNPSRLAQFAGLFLKPKEERQKPVPLLVVSSCESEISALEKQQEMQTVYNLEVEDAHEYYANGILVHNCSWRRPESFTQMLLGLRLGDDPRCAIATTPKPVKHLRELLARKGVVKTAGTTYENRENLAVAWFEEIITQYEGSNLGKQELLGEILDNLGALWSIDLIDKYRIKFPQTVPPLERVIVSVDPAVSSGEESSETGIILSGVARVNRVKHCYVLDDLTCKGSPETWGKIVVDAYRDAQANAVVVEVNNGGDLVRANIHAIDPEVNVIEVRASKGKVARAEPIVTYYEQGKVHHDGVFAELERQQSEWMVGQKSPDRLDALTWGITALMSSDDEAPVIRQGVVRYKHQLTWET